MKLIFRNSGLGTKIFVGFGIIFFLLVAALFWGYRQLDQSWTGFMNYQQTVENLIVEDELDAETKIYILAETAKNVFGQSVEDVPGRFLVLLGVVLPIAILAFILLGLWISKHETLPLKEQIWLKASHQRLNEQIWGEQSLEELCTNIIRYMAELLGAQIGVIYTVLPDQRYAMTGRYAVLEEKMLQQVFKPGEGLLGQAALTKNLMLINDVPAEFMKICSGTGKACATNLVIVPYIFNDEVKCIVELGSFQKFTEIQIQFLKEIGQTVVTSVNSAQIRCQMQELLAETIQQKEELKIKQKELQENNIALEDSTIVLKETEAYLLHQQEELQYANQELEERARVLEEQKAAIYEQNENLNKANLEIEKKAKELELANQYKSEFLANVSHELRTPLNSILVLSEILAEKKDNKPLTEKQIEFAQTIHSSGKDLLELINSILDLSKMETGRMSFNMELMNLHELATYVEASFGQIAVNKNLQFVVEVDKALPECIYTDPQKVKQMVRNLLSNAFKFTEKGMVSFKITRPEPNMRLLHDRVKANQTICIVVSDTGIGIPEEKHSFVFEAFRQLDGTTSRKYDGTGLGLTITKDLINLLGGEILLSSREGIGSTFTLVLPEFSEHHLAKAASNEQIISLEEPTDFATQSEDPRPLEINDTAPITKVVNQILVVENDQNSLKEISALMNQRDHRFTNVNSGKEAYTLLQAKEFDCMILNLDLIDQSAIELLAHLDADGIVYPPVIVYTENELTSELRSELTKYAKSVLIKGSRFATRLVTETEMLLHHIDLNFQEQRQNHQYNIFQSKKILLIDDDMRNVFALSSILEEKNVQVVVSRNIQDGLAKLQKNSDIDLLIINPIGPGDGCAAIKQIRSNQAYESLPIITLMSNSLKYEREYCIAAGANDYIEKPIDEDRFLALLAIWLRQ